MTPENALTLDSPEKFILLDVLHAEKKKIEKYLEENQNKRAELVAKKKDTYRLWENYFEKQRQLKVVVGLIEKTRGVNTSAKHLKKV